MIEYKNQGKTNENLENYISRRVEEVNLANPNLELVKNYRALRVAAFLGLIKMKSSSYEDSEIMPTYYEILERTSGQFEKEDLYYDIIERQLEKMFLSTSIDELWSSLRKEFRLFPLMYLYKILLEIGKSTGEYYISNDEYRYFVTTASKYENYLDTLLLITAYRNSQDAKEIFNNIQNKPDSRVLVAFKCLKTLVFDNNGIRLNSEFIEIIKEKIYIFDQNIDKFTLDGYFDFLGSKEKLVDIKNNAYRKLSDDELENIKSGPIYDIDNINGDAVNEIYYGTPGCGKSYEVDKKYVNGKDNIVIRTVFHPEYSNSDFVGQIVPTLTEIEENGKIVKKINYEYKNGPFVNALIEAIRNKDKKVILIIEEINRGNASAIFGEIFQLLDRNDKGISNYHITNKQITEALDKALELGNSIVNIKIPGNLYIVATMNTSDQNVFTLDTAFKRRWDLIRIPNDFKGEYGEKLGDMYIPGSDYTWKDFVDKINNNIVLKNKNGLYSEDKQIGAYFVTSKFLCNNKNENNEDKAIKFANKVLMYIWEDIARLNPSGWFEGINSLENLCNEFISRNINDSKLDSLEVFKDIFKKEENSGE